MFKKINEKIENFTKESRKLLYITKWKFWNLKIP